MYNEIWEGQNRFEKIHNICDPELRPPLQPSDIYFQGNFFVFSNLQYFTEVSYQMYVCRRICVSLCKSNRICLCIVPNYVHNRCTDMVSPIQCSFFWFLYMEGLCLFFWRVPLPSQEKKYQKIFNSATRHHNWQRHISSTARCL